MRSHGERIKLPNQKLYNMVISKGGKKESVIKKEERTCESLNALMLLARKKNCLLTRAIPYAISVIAGREENLKKRKKSFKKKEKICRVHI